MKKLARYESFESDNLEHIGSGTEGEVYSDGKFAYKVVSESLVGDISEIKKYVGKHFKNVVNIFDAYLNEDGEIVIKMELLEEVDESIFDEEDYEYAREALWLSENDVSVIDEILPHIKDQELIKALKGIQNAAKELETSTLDIGFHNIMYDPKTKEYKQIDIF
jgi:hypothetical protein